MPVKDHGVATPTAVKVALRVRPLTTKEQLANASECVSHIPNEPQVLVGTDRSFTFDYIFKSSTTQQQVFDDCANPLLEKFVEGFNVTILAYGQTGSGKTYSMGTGFDPTNNPNSRGIIPRSMEKLFDIMQKRERDSSRFSYQVYVSFLELYNEELNDLLNPQPAEKKSGGVHVSIREDSQGNIYWSGVKEEMVRSADELMSFLQKGSFCRTTGSTDMNLTSSRSHAIFSVILKQQRVDDEQDSPPHSPSLNAVDTVEDDFFDSSTEDNDNVSDNSKPKTRNSVRRLPKGIVKGFTSKFHFVDLAGSERLKRTNAVGERAKEGIAINTGLLALGNVISALGDETKKITHVPYRDSKLTRLLQDSLGGNSQTLMLACVSASDSDFMETLNTLKYANRARNIRNKVMINQDFGGNSVEINQLRTQLARLKMEIATLREGNENDEESKALKSEIIRLRDRVKDTYKELSEVRTERDSLLYSKNEKESVEVEVDEDEEARKKHPLVEGYTRTIMDLRLELANTRDRLAFMEETVSPTGIRRQSLSANLIDPLRVSWSSAMYRNSRGSDEDDDETETIKSLRNSRSSVSSKKRRGSRRGRVTKPRGVVTSQQMIRKLSEGALKLEALTNDNEIKTLDIIAEPEIGRSRSTTNKSASQQKELNAMLRSANAEIEKGRELMKLIPSLSKRSKHNDDPINDLLVPSLPNFGKVDPENNDTNADEDLAAVLEIGGEQKDRNGLDIGAEIDWQGDLLQGIDALKVPSWESPKTHRRMKDRTEENSEYAPSTTAYSTTSNWTARESTSPELLRMIHKVQADIIVKEDLVAQLERNELEYEFMRANYEEQMAALQENLIGVERERDQALRRIGFGGTVKTAANSPASSRPASPSPKSKEVSEVTTMYESKMKKLLAEIALLRSKYTESSQSADNVRHQNESLLRQMRAHVDNLRNEKLRMVKRMKQEADRAREEDDRKEREIMILKRKERQAEESVRKLERDNELQQVILKKRQEEAVQSTIQLQRIMAVFRRSPQARSIAMTALTGLPNKRKKVKGVDFHDLSSNRSSKKKIPAYVRAIRKKQLLDRAIFTYINGKKSSNMMEQLITKREGLVEEKTELLTKRERLIKEAVEEAERLGKQFNSGQPQYMDERIELINAEVSYLNARIRALQSEAAEGAVSTPPESSDSDGPMEKRVNFAEDVSGGDDWVDVDSADESFSVSPSAAPDAAYDTAVSLISSLNREESTTVATSLVSDVISLRATDFERQMSVENLEKQVLDLRRTLLTMRKVAVEMAIENGRKIRELERIIREYEGIENDDLSDNEQEIHNTKMFDNILLSVGLGFGTNGEDEDGLPPLSLPASPGFPMGPTSLHAVSHYLSREMTPSPDSMLYSYKNRWQSGSESPSPTSELSAVRSRTPTTNTRTKRSSMPARHKSPTFDGHSEDGRSGTPDPESGRTSAYGYRRQRTTSNNTNSFWDELRSGTPDTDSGRTSAYGNRRQRTISNNTNSFWDELRSGTPEQDSGRTSAYGNRRQRTISGNSNLFDDLRSGTPDHEPFRSSTFRTGTPDLSTYRRTRTISNNSYNGDVYERLANSHTQASIQKIKFHNMNDKAGVNGGYDHETAFMGRSTMGRSRDHDQVSEA